MPPALHRHDEGLGTGQLFQHVSRQWNQDRPRPSANASGTVDLRTSVVDGTHTKGVAAIEAEEHGVDVNRVAKRLHHSLKAHLPVACDDLVPYAR